MAKQKILDVILKEVRQMVPEAENVNEFTSLEELNFSLDELSRLAYRLRKVLKEQGIVSFTDRFKQSTLEDLADYIAYVSGK